jgi:glycosyltransferase involved in cell wall biosynthesis
LVLAGKPGDESYVNRLHLLAQQLNIAQRIHFLGSVENIPALNAEIDIFVFPSRRMEGCPVALLEAMACGLPCIATNIPGSQDIIEHGASGILVPPEAPDALADALRQLINSASERARLGVAARQRILEHYTIEREVAAHEALYAEILGI